MPKRQQSATSTSNRNKKKPRRGGTASADAATTVSDQRRHVEKKKQQQQQNAAASSAASSLDPLGATLHKRRVQNGDCSVLQQYFCGISIQRHHGHEQQLFVGDLIAYITGAGGGDNDGDAAATPSSSTDDITTFNRGNSRHRIGQLLGVREDRSSTDSAIKYYAIVRQLWHQELFGACLTKQQTKTMKSSCRVSHALLETDVVEIVPIHNSVLPVRVTLTDTRSGSDKHYKETPIVANDDARIVVGHNYTFFVYGSLFPDSTSGNGGSKNKKLAKDAASWKGYHDRRPGELPLPAVDDGALLLPPDPLIRGFDYLRSFQSNQQDDSHTSSMKSLADAMKNNLIRHIWDMKKQDMEREEKSKAMTQLERKHQADDDDDGERTGDDQEEDDDSVVDVEGASNKENRRGRRGRPAPPTQKEKGSTSEKRGAPIPKPPAARRTQQNKRGKGAKAAANKKCNGKKNQEEEEESCESGDEDRDEEESVSTVTEKRKNTAGGERNGKKKKPVPAALRRVQQQQKMKKKKVPAAAARYKVAASAVVRPLSSVVHRIPDKGFSFYTAVQVNHMTICVGDILAVADSTAYGTATAMAKNPKTGDSDNDASIDWSPFNQPWNAGQVISIYQHESSASACGKAAPVAGNGFASQSAPPQQIYMQVRWFYWPQELPFDCRELRRQAGARKDAVVVEVDEHVGRVPVTAALGRVSINQSAVRQESAPTTATTDNGGSNSNNGAAVPTVVASLTCHHIYCSQWDEGRVRRLNESDGGGGDKDADGWTNYGSRLSGPLSRGLCCEKAWPGKVPALLRVYKKFIVEQYRLAGEHLDIGMTLKLAKPGLDGGEATGDEHEAITWPAHLLAETQVLVPEIGPIWGNCTIEFLCSALVPVNKRYDPRAISSKNRTEHWELKVGDIVTFADLSLSCDGAASPFLCTDKTDRSSRRKKTTKNPWYPFVGRWSVCQVLTIYRQKHDDETLVEIRRFLRREDLPVSVQEWMPPSTATGAEEVHIFETDIVERDVPASHVLGPVEMFFAHSTKASKRTSSEEGSSCAPTVPCRCRYFYSKEKQRFQPLYCSDKTPAGWFDCILERGFKASTFIQEYAGLRAGIEFDAAIALDRNDGLEALFGSMFEATNLPSTVIASEPAKALREQPCTSSSENTRSRVFFLSAPIQPQWSSYVQADILCVTRDRQGLLWTVRVGDLVAIRTAEASGRDWFPFTESWRPGQVLSIYRHEGSCEHGFAFEIRWFDRKEGRSSKDLELLDETQAVCDKPVTASRLLGPISLFSGSSASSVWNAHPAFLPVTPFVPINNFSRVIERGVDLSPSYDREIKKQILQQLREEAEDLRESGTCYQLPLQLMSRDPSEEVVKKTRRSILCSPLSSGSSADAARVWTPSEPVYKSATHEFYDKLVVNLEDENDSGETRRKKYLNWEVELGDFVAMQFVNGRSKAETGYGEVVTMFKTQKVEAIDDSESATSASSSMCDGMMLEIRWFYQEKEIPARKKRSTKGNTETAFESIYESDHYDQVSASCLHRPAILHGDAKASVAMASKIAEVKTFAWRGFWSLHRKSVIPSGSLGSRITRGRMHSSFFTKNVGLKSAIEGLESDATDDGTALLSVNRNLSPADSFKRVIEKLSLTDASKEAGGTGSALVGRDKERRQILKFLRSAISGRAADTKPSLFVAGPPGVGKTASVRAAINDLRREQSSGKLPAFDFFTLNGMEMRDPYEAYIKLWEDVCGDKALYNAQIAASKLQSYFSRGDSIDENNEKRVVVVLVDEIDYLVTKPQDVLYNLFDWPMKSLHCARRLVVIGVSNTLNLPERMHPRFQSRIGSGRCYFKSYNEKEIISILESKIQKASPRSTTFKADAIRFAAMKTAALSGDIRKAFKICRSAAELVLNEIEKKGELAPSGNPCVRVSHIQEVIRASVNSAQSRRITLCSSFEALLLIALASLTKSSGRERGGFDVEEIVAKMEGMANATGDHLHLPPPSLCETLDILSRLSEANFVALNTPRNSSLSYRASIAGSGGAWPLVYMNIDDATVILTALKSTPYKRLAEKYLNTSGFVL